MKRAYILLVLMAFTITFLSRTSFAAESFQPITLKYADAVVEKSWFGNHHKWWASEVEKRSNGKIKVQIFWMESLVKWKDMLPGVQSGMADLGWISSTYHPSNLPLYIILDNVSNFHQDYAAAILALIDTLDNEPNLRAEMERENIILVSPHIAGQAGIGTKRCFDSIKDLKGKTLRTYGGSRTQFFEYLGANPVFMSYSDLYEAMDRGTVSAIDMVPVLSAAFKHYEVVKCIYLLNCGGALASGTYMNRKLFNKFPNDIQKMFIDLRREYAIRYGESLMDDEDKAYREWQTKYGVTIKHPSPDDQKLIQDASKKAIEYMLKKQESDGHTAVRKVWDHYTKALKKFEDQRAKKK